MERAMEIYLNQFENLHTAKMGGRQAPHKAILLLAIMELVKEGAITSERIELTEDLDFMFLGIWHETVGKNLLYKPNIDKPFWHMQNEPFYNLYMKDGGDLSGFGNPYSVRKLREKTYAVIDRELFELMRNDVTREALQVALERTYLQGWDSGIKPSALPMIILAEMLIRMVA